MPELKLSLADVAEEAVFQATALSAAVECAKAFRDRVVETVGHVSIGDGSNPITEAISGPDLIVGHLEAAARDANRVQIILSAKFLKETDDE